VILVYGTKEGIIVICTNIGTALQQQHCRLDVAITSSVSKSQLSIGMDINSEVYEEPGRCSVSILCRLLQSFFEVLLCSALQWKALTLEKHSPDVITLSTDHERLRLHQVDQKFHSCGPAVFGKLGNGNHHR
jgi:hypothetical protein